MPVLIYHISKDIKVRKHVILRKVWGKDIFILCYWEQIVTTSMEVSLMVSRKITKCICPLTQQPPFSSSSFVRPMNVRVSPGLCGPVSTFFSSVVLSSSMSVNSFYMPVTLTLNLQFRDSCALQTSLPKQPM